MPRPPASTPSPRPHLPEPTEGPPPWLSVVIPVYREGTLLNYCLDNLEQVLAGQPAEVIVVHGYSGATPPQGPKRMGVRSLISKKGRGTQMNAGADAARGEVLLFLHADTRLPPGAFNALQTPVLERNCVAGAFSLSIESPHLFLRAVSWGATLRSRLSRIPYGDQAIFILRERFRQLGGYRDYPALEDVDLMERVKAGPGRVEILPQRVRTSARRYERYGNWHTIIRNRLLMLRYLAGAHPRRLVRE